MNFLAAMGRTVAARPNLTRFIRFAVSPKPAEHSVLMDACADRSHLVVSLAVRDARAHFGELTQSAFVQGHDERLTPEGAYFLLRKLALVGSPTDEIPNLLGRQGIGQDWSGSPLSDVTSRANRAVYEACRFTPTDKIVQIHPGDAPFQFFSAEAGCQTLLEDFRMWSVRESTSMKKLDRYFSRATTILITLGLSAWAGSPYLQSNWVSGLCVGSLLGAITIGGLGLTYTRSRMTDLDGVIVREPEAYLRQLQIYLGAHAIGMSPIDADLAALLPQEDPDMPPPSAPPTDPHFPRVIERRPKP